MGDPLGLLLQEGIIEAVITGLKSGKEADIHLVQHRGEIVAAKIYKARHERSFRNNAAYREGRQVRNSRTQRAIQKGSRFGQAAAEEDWKARESDALHRLHAAGVRVPQPILFYEGILLMEVVVDPEGHPAPRLIDARIDRAHAAAQYADLRGQAIRMLMNDLIHGDLSPYNVLLAWNGPTVIDFPQVIDAAHNQQAASFFERDLKTLWRFYSAIDPSLRSHEEDAAQIWRAWQRRELSADFVPSPRTRQAGPGPQRPQQQQRQSRAEPPPQNRRRDAGRDGNREERAGGGPRRGRPGPAKPERAAGPQVSYVGQTPKSAPAAAAKDGGAASREHGGGQAPSRRRRRRGRRGAGGGGRGPQ